MGFIRPCDHLRPQKYVLGHKHILWHSAFIQLLLHRTGVPYPRPKTPPGEMPGPPTEEEVQVISNSKTRKHQPEHPSQVEERLVGAVLGPSGRHVEEIKQYR